MGQATSMSSNNTIGNPELFENNYSLKQNIQGAKEDNKLSTKKDTYISSLNCGFQNMREAEQLHIIHGKTANEIGSFIILVIFPRIRIQGESFFPPYGSFSFCWVLSSLTITLWHKQWDRLSCLASSSHIEHTRGDYHSDSGQDKESSVHNVVFREVIWKH